MAVKVANAATAAAKFAQRAQAAGQQYTDGVKSAGADWEAKTAASADNWSAGVNEAVANRRFEKGVQGSGGTYATRSSTVGAVRYGPAVATAGPAWQAGTAPYLQTIANLNLPARQVKGNPANYQRMIVIADALRQQKVNS